MSNQPRVKALLLFTTFMVFLTPLPAKADILLEKSLVRRFETDWCPFFGQLNLYFIATTLEAILTFGYTGPEGWPAQIDNVAIVAEDKLIASSGNYANFRSGGNLYGFDFECYGEPFFQASRTDEDGVPFKEFFEDSSLSRWALDNAHWSLPSSAPISLSDPPDLSCSTNYYRKRSQDTGSLTFDGPNSQASVHISNLVIGKNITLQAGFTVA